MDDSTNTLLYTATYVFIFITALSLSIVLFFSVNKYADSAFEYKQGLSGSIINTSGTGTEMVNVEGNNYVPLTREDVFSYFVNYVKKDLYGEGYNGSQDVVYNVYITDPESGHATLDSSESYQSVKRKLNYKDKYYLEYRGEYIQDNKKHVEVYISPVNE